MPIEDVNGQSHSPATGRFLGRGLTAPVDNLLGATGPGSTLGTEGLRLLGAWTDHAATDSDAGPVVTATPFRSRYDAIEIVDDYGTHTLVKSRDGAALILSDEIENGAGYRVPTPILTAKTKVAAIVFDLLKALDHDEAGAAIGTILEATNSAWDIADAMADDDELLGWWLATGDGQATPLGEDCFGFRRG